MHTSIRLHAAYTDLVTSRYMRLTGQLPACFSSCQDATAICQRRRDDFAASQESSIMPPPSHLADVTCSELTLFSRVTALIHPRRKATRYMAAARPATIGDGFSTKCHPCPVLPTANKSTR